MDTSIHPPTLWRQPWFERIYIIGLIVKGIDGVLEFIAGMAILISPSLVHRFLTMLSGEFGEHNARPFQFIAEYIGHVDANLLHSGLVFLTLFLIFHGVIKIGLVYCLVRRIEKVYPIALILLIAFFLYEVYVFITTLSIPLAVFMALDLGIIWLVWNEYQEVKSKAKAVIK
jgi:uncharacterized membrane protein